MLAQSTQAYNPEEKSGTQAGVGCNAASVQLRVYRLYYDDLFMSFGHIHIPTTGQEPDKLWHIRLLCKTLYSMCMVIGKCLKDGALPVHGMCYM